MMQNETYLNKIDGLLYCLKCNTPTQTVFEDRKYSCFCDCGAEEQKKREIEQEAERKQKRADEIRNRCIKQLSCQNYNFKNDNGKDPKTISDMRKILSQLPKFKEKGMGVMLWGGVGTGKTYAAYCLVNALIDQEVPVYCTSLTEIISLAQKFDDYERTLARILQFKFILLDDLGTERQTSFGQEQAYYFINECITRNITLIITTNIPPSKLQAAANDTSDLNYARLYSRILERCLPVKVNNVKQRFENQTQNHNEMIELLRKSEVSNG